MIRLMASSISTVRSATKAPRVQAETAESVSLALQASMEMKLASRLVSHAGGEPLMVMLGLPVTQIVQRVQRAPMLLLKALRNVSLARRDQVATALAWKVTTNAP